MFFRRLVSAIFVCILDLTCFSARPSIAQEGDFVFILAAHDNPYWNTLGEGIREAAKDRGIIPVLYAAKNGQDAEGELNICLTALMRKPKILVMGSLNSSIGLQCFKKAQEQGVIVADVDATVSVAEASQTGVKLAFSVGSDNYQVGEEGAKYAKSALTKPDPRIVVIEGITGSVPGKKRVDGFKTKIREILPQAKIVASLTANWDRLKAMNMTADILQREPDIDLFYVANDTMALGAAEAIRNMGKQDRVKIIGVDGTADARKAVQAGRLLATVAQLPYLMGRRAVELAGEAVAHPEKTGITEITPTPVLDKAALDPQNKNPLLQYVR